MICVLTLFGEMEFQAALRKNFQNNDIFFIEENCKVPFSFSPAHMNKQRAGAVAALGEVYYRDGKVQTAEEHKPDYLRLSQAERERMEQNNGKA